MSFEVLKSETVYKGKIFNILKEEVQLPDGRKGIFDIIEHNSSVAILPVDNNQMVWLVRQYRYPIKKTLLEIPAGVMEEGEDPAYCAQRELREEIGMGAGKLELLGRFYLARGYSTEYMYIFMASSLFESHAKPDDDEFIHIEKYPINEILRMARNDEFEDAKTLAALFLGYSRLEEMTNLK